MIDCGGTTELLELVSLSPEMIIYVLDSHRPYSLRNIFDNTQVNLNFPLSLLIMTD